MGCEINLLGTSRILKNKIEFKILELIASSKNSYMNFLFQIERQINIQNPRCVLGQDVLCLVTQSYPTLWDPMDCSLLVSSVHRDSLGKNTELSRHALLQVVFPTQGSNPGVQANSLPSEPPGKPKNAGVCSLPLLQGIFLTQELNQGLLHCRQIFYQLSYQVSPGQDVKCSISYCFGKKKKKKNCFE